jgi:predicted glutamine amidotransferase
MCRWLAYSGSPLLLETLLFKAEHSLIDQSMTSKSAETPTNGDGFGVGWFDTHDQPGLFRSIRPAWNDFNLRDLAAHIESPMFLAHVRATSLATVQETNCHPFRYGPLLFVHNGEIFEIEKIRRELLLRVDPALFSSIQGNTDSELLFFLALTFGLAADPIGGLQRMAGFVEAVARRAGVPESLWMTVAVADGRRITAVRYASDGAAPTLYHSRAMDDLYGVNPALRGMFSSESRAIVSEPVGKFASSWVEVPQNTVLTLARGEIVQRRFQPAAPAA